MVQKRVFDLLSITKERGKEIYNNEKYGFKR